MDDQPHDPNAPGHDAATCPICSGDVPADEDPLKKVQQTVADEHEQHQQDEAQGNA